MQRVGNEVIRLALLEAIELESLTINQLLAQIKDTVSAAGGGLASLSDEGDLGGEPRQRPATSRPAQIWPVS